MNTKLKHLQIGDLTARLPIIQGGMGVGVSLSKLAGAVAKEGGVGIISTAQIGYDEEGFEKDQAGCNRLAIRKHIQKAKEIACGNGLIGVNIMVALKHYEEHVKEAVAAGADVFAHLAQRAELCEAVGGDVDVVEGAVDLAEGPEGALGKSSGGLGLAVVKRAGGRRAHGILRCEADSTLTCGVMRWRAP